MNEAKSKKNIGLVLRPYQLLCTICSLGEEGLKRDQRYDNYKKIIEKVKKNPDIPVTVACHTSSLFSYQDPTTGEDTPEAYEFNRKRDLDILQILDIAPGYTLPARALFTYVVRGIDNVSGICGYGTPGSGIWKGCPKAESGNYERGHEKALKKGAWASSLSEIFVEPRSEEEMALEKERSLQALYSANVVPIRPHIIPCSVCQYGAGIRPPFKEDNLPELLEMIFDRNGDVKLKMVPGADWMICAPCPARSEDLNCCTHGTGYAELDNSKRDMDFLQKLDLRFGSVIKALDLYPLMFEKIKTTYGVPDICLRNNTTPTPWFGGQCGKYLYDANPDAKYVKGRLELQKKFEVMREKI